MTTLADGKSSLGGGGGGFIAHPSGLRRQAEQAEKRREKKTEAMRKLRKEGRIKS